MTAIDSHYGGGALRFRPRLRSLGSERTFAPETRQSHPPAHEVMMAMRHQHRVSLAPEPKLHRWLDELRQDVRYALRQLQRAPGFAALVVLTLAIGIGANATMAGAIDRLLLRAPAHIHEPDHVARLVVVSPNPIGGAPLAGKSTNYPTLLELERGVSAFESVAGYSGAALSYGAGADAVPLRAAMVSASYFSVLGVTPTLGRFFSPADGFPTGEAAGGPPLAVLGYGFWQRQFGGDRGILGRQVRLGKLTYTVVGVAPPGFQGVDTEPPDVWVPITVAAEVEGSGWAYLWDRGSTWLSVVARLRPGASRAAAEQQATAIWLRDAPPTTRREEARRVVAASVIRGRGPDAPREVRVALWLGGVAALVLLIVCANVANLLLGRAFTRRREIAVRLALGAGRARLARQMLTEALLLSALGAAAAIYLAALGGRLLQRLFVSDLAAGGFVDGRLFAFTALVAIGTGVAISLVPLLQSIVPDLATTLRTGGGAGGGRTSRVRSVLLGTQAALCVLLLVGAGLFAQSLRRVQGLDLGVDAAHTLMAWFDLNVISAPRPEIDAAYDAMRERVLAIPGVSRTALVTNSPFGGGRAVAIHTPTRDADEIWKADTYPLSYSGHQLVPIETAVDSGFFRAAGTTSLRGRDFEAGDRPGAPRVAIINDPLARILFPGEEALGQCVFLPARSDIRGGECVTIVGVLSGFWRRSILDREALAIYIPLAQQTVTRGLGRPNGMLVRVSGDPAALLPAVRQAIQSVRPDLPAVRVTLLSDPVDQEVRPWRLAAGMFTLFGGVALVIAVVGLYGVVAFAAAQRSSEIAVRRALGARARDVLLVVGRDGLRAVGAGLAVGTTAALLVRRWVGPLLFQTSPSDPGVIGGVVLSLLAVALLASLVPTVRALRKNPAAVLRVE